MSDPTLFACAPAVKPRRPSDAEVIAAYNGTRNVWKAAKLLGIAGQTVHKRLRKMGKGDRMRHLSNPEKEKIKDLYGEGFVRGDGKLHALAKSIDRTKQFICRYAGSVGLTNNGRSTTDAIRRSTSERIRNYIKTAGHPRGALGMKHTEGTKFLLAMRSRASWESVTPEQKSARSKKIIKARGEARSTHHRTGSTWRAGWRVIAGRKIFFRSRWEYNYAVYLENLVARKQIRSWEHEPKTFLFEAASTAPYSCLPDFRVALNDGAIEYHEVKGWNDARSKKQQRRMRQFYPEIKVLFVRAKWFKANSFRMSKLPGWEPDDE